MIENKESGWPLIIYKETVTINSTVKCSVYNFAETDGKDLGIITINKGGKTPLQRVVDGERTVEGHLWGKGRLVVTKVDGTKKVYPVSNDTGDFSKDVEVGDLMQW